VLARGRTARRRALSVVAAYCIVATAWIAGSDALVAAFAPDTLTIVQLSVFKGVFFVGATTLLLHVLLRRLVNDVERSVRQQRHAERARDRNDIARRRSEAILNSTTDAVLSVDLEGHIESLNPAAAAMFGISFDDVIGRPMTDLIPLHPDAYEGLLVRIAKGEPIEAFEIDFAQASGSTSTGLITSWPIHDASPAGQPESHVIGASFIVRDISLRKRMETIAAQERAFADNLVEALPGVVYLYDENGTFLRWNESFARVTGFRDDEIARMKPDDFFEDVEKDLLRSRIAAVFREGEANVEANFRRKDGTTIPYLFTGRRITFGGKLCLLGVGLDIRERRFAENALRKSRERYLETLDVILEGCQLLDHDWRYLYLNDAASKHNRRPNDELIGRVMQEAWPGIEQSHIYSILDRSKREGVEVHEETEFQFPDGSSGWFDVRAQPTPEGLFILSIDITERRKAERALRQLNEDLEAKILERTADLEAARIRAQDADRIKSAFLATMSHELRTPLNSIIGFTGILLQGLAGSINDEQKKQLGMVRNSARHLLDLINDVLDISKIEAGQLEVRAAPFDLRESIDRVVDSIRPLATQRGLSVEIQAPTSLSMRSDKRRVEQILLNLLNNAIKFTERGGVTLTVDLV